MYTGIRLLLLIHPLISSFFFLSNFQTLKCFVTLFSRTVRPRRLKLSTHVDSKQMYGVYRNQAAAAYLSLYFFISSPEPSGSQGELIVYPYSGVRRRRCRCQQCLNIFSSETTWPIKAKLYVEPPWEGGTKVCINGPGHMTKMAAMPIYGKNL